MCKFIGRGLCDTRSASLPPDTERQLAALLDTASGKPAAIVFLHPHLRDVAIAYPDDFQGVKDLSLQESPDQSGTLWGENRAVNDDQLPGLGEVWFIGDGKGAPHDLSTFTAAGCSEIRTLPYQRLTLVAFNCS